jgi:psp operon transcriptional activator
VDVRVVAATNEELEPAIREGRFRADPLDRLSFEVIRVPPLRERIADIRPLSTFFVEEFAREVPALSGKRISPAALALLERSPFPGNVRELKSAVERAATMEEGPEIGVAAVTAALGRGHRPPPPTDDEEPEPGRSLKERVESFERRALLGALEEHAWNQRAAARALGLTYDQLRHLYKKHDLARPAPS